MNTLKELFLEAARVAELEKQYPGIYTIKYRGNFYNVASLISGFINWMPYISDIEFALAVVECKSVFKGDVLYDHHPAHKESPMFTAEYSLSKYMSRTVSWLPPKPKTVMVEFDTDIVTRLKDAPENFYYNGVSLKVIAVAFSKALEGLK